MNFGALVSMPSYAHSSCVRICVNVVKPRMKVTKVALTGCNVASVAIIALFILFKSPNNSASEVVC